MMAVLPSNPRANYLAHKNEIDAAIQRVLDSGRYILGQEVKAFEEEFANYIGVRFAVGVGSGTDALNLALRSCGIGPGDLVVTVSHTAVATVAAIGLCGARPILVDIDPQTFNMDPTSLEGAIAEQKRISQPSAGRLKAIIPVHLYGNPAEMPEIMEIARKYDLHVIEDCAQSHGASLDGRKTGSWGHMAAFSFYPTKNLGALGDGGMVVTNDATLAEQARSMREYGWKERYVSEITGTNTRLDELQAAVLRVKLRYLDKENAQRRKLAGIYDTLLQRTSVKPPFTRAHATHVYHQYVVRSEARDRLRAHLRDIGVETLIHYPLPVHLQPAYRDHLPSFVTLENTEDVVRQILSLPMYPELGEDQVEMVASKIVAWEKSRG